MTTPIWLQSLKDSPDPGTKEFAKLFDTVPYSRVRDQINRSPTLQQDIIEFATGTGRFDGRGPGVFTTEGIQADAAKYLGGTISIGVERLQGVFHYGAPNPVADGGPVLAHEIQHAFNRAELTIPNLPNVADAAFGGSRSPNVVWNGLLDEAETQLHQYVVAKEIYDREKLNFEVDASATLPILRMDAGRAVAIEQWLGEGSRMFSGGRIPSPDYLARVKLAEALGNGDRPSGVPENNYVDYYANNGRVSATDADRMQRVQILSVGDGKLSVVFTNSGNNPSALIFTQAVTVDGQGAWNAEICCNIPVPQPSFGLAPARTFDGQALSMVGAVVSDAQGNTSVPSINPTAAPLSNTTHQAI